MELAQQFVEYVLHLEEHLTALTDQYGTWVYGILFAIIFLETGVVVTPFLPGDSLLFAAGTLAAVGTLNVMWLFVLLFIAAVLGDSVNYWIGSRVGPRAFEKDYRFLKRKHLARTQEFYAKHGGKTIFLARFVPIVRTFAPFVAGIGTMNYRRFVAYNIAGAFCWVGIFVFAGYFFGNIPVVQDNFGLVIAAIIVLSLVPMVYEAWRVRQESAAEGAPPA
jgi:membrane-associated protein